MGNIFLFVLAMCLALVNSNGTRRLYRGYDSDEFDDHSGYLNDYVCIRYIFLDYILKWILQNNRK